MHSDLRKLIEPSSHIYQPRDMCDLSKDFAMFEWSKPNHLYKVSIQNKLREEAAVQGPVICDKCLIIPVPEITACFRIDIQNVLSHVTEPEMV